MRALFCLGVLARRFPRRGDTSVQPRESASSHLPVRHRPFLVSGLPLDAGSASSPGWRSVAASALHERHGRVTDRHRRAVPGRETSAPGVILSPPVPLCGAGDAAYLDVHVRGCNRVVADRLPQRVGRRREAL